MSGHGKSEVGGRRSDANAAAKSEVGGRRSDAPSNAELNAIDREVMDSFTDGIDAVMSFAEVVPWGKRWAAQIPQVFGPFIEDEALTALAELREQVADDLDAVYTRLHKRWKKERGA